MWISLDHRLPQDVNNAQPTIHPPSLTTSSMTSSSSSSSSSTPDYFKVMGLESTATEAEIKKKFKKLSLILHPDKNPNQDPIVAASRFHELKLAYEVLMDPSARMAAQQKTKAEHETRERRGAFEGERRKMAEDLEIREMQDRNKKRRIKEEELQQKRTLDRLKEESRKLKEERNLMRQREQQLEREMKDKGKEKESNQQDQIPPPLGPLDLSVLLKFPSSQYEFFSKSSTDSDANANANSSTASTNSIPSTNLYKLLLKYGPITSLIMMPPKSKSKKDGSCKVSKEASAHVTFERLDSAYAVVMKGNQMGFEQELIDVWAGWASGKGKTNQSLEGEPERIKWLRKSGRLGNWTAEELEREGQSRDLDHESDGINLEEKPSFSFNPNTNANQKQNQNQNRNGNRDGTESQDAPPSFSFSFSNPPQSSSSSSFNPPSDLDYESETLLRLREAERKRVEEEILDKERRQEEEERASKRERNGNGNGN